ncbi:MAG: hypothetical protein U1F98_09225 [Verrucomicrobiota bacterium]
MSEFFNLYYLHWWSLTHFLLESQTNISAAELVRTGGEPGRLEELYGPLPQMEAQGHLYVRRLRSALNGNDLIFFRTGRLSPEPPAP